MRFGKKSQSEIVEILQVTRLPDRAFAEVKTAEGEVQWEEISPKEARREKKRLRQYRVIKKRPRKDLAPAIKPVVKIGANGVISFGSNLTYKGIGSNGRPQYWHIPTATILVEEVGYAARQMANTLLMLKVKRGLVGARKVRSRP